MRKILEPSEERLPEEMEKQDLTGNEDVRIYNGSRGYAFTETPGEKTRRIMDPQNGISEVYLKSGHLPGDATATGQTPAQLHEDNLAKRDATMAMFKPGQVTQHRRRMFETQDRDAAMQHQVDLMDIKTNPNIVTNPRGFMDQDGTATWAPELQVDDNQSAAVIAGQLITKPTPPRPIMDNGTVAIPNADGGWEVTRPEVQPWTPAGGGMGNTQNGAVNVPQVTTPAAPQEYVNGQQIKWGNATAVWTDKWGPVDPATNKPLIQDQRQLIDAISMAVDPETRNALLEVLRGQTAPGGGTGKENDPFADYRVK